MAKGDASFVPLCFHLIKSFRKFRFVDSQSELAVLIRVACKMPQKSYRRRAAEIRQRKAQEMAMTRGMCQELNEINCSENVLLGQATIRMRCAFVRLDADMTK